jgi:L-rhamnose mutarotase
MRTLCFALDLHDDPGLIEEYKRYHQLGNIWPEVLQSICVEGILREQIYLAGNRLFMILQTEDDFRLEKKAEADAGNESMRQWEELMWKYQKPLPFAKPGQKWVPMVKIFDLECATSTNEIEQSERD